MNTPTTSNAQIRGLSYPLSVTNGNLSVSQDFDLKSQEIRSVIETRFFERVLRADYGSNDYTLEALEPGLINSELYNYIKENVEGLTSLEVQGDWQTSGEDGIYRVFITYEVSGIPQPSMNFSLGG